MAAAAAASPPLPPPPTGRAQSTAGEREDGGGERGTGGGEGAGQGPQRSPRRGACCSATRAQLLSRAPGRSAGRAPPHLHHPPRACALARRSSCARAAAAAAAAVFGRCILPALWVQGLGGGAWRSPGGALLPGGGCTPGLVLAKASPPPPHTHTRLFCLRLDVFSLLFLPEISLFSPQTAWCEQALLPTLPPPQTWGVRLPLRCRPPFSSPLYPDVGDLGVKNCTPRRCLSTV